MVMDVNNTAKNCRQCQRMSAKVKHHRQVELFPPADSLGFLAIVMLGAISRTNTETEFVVIVTGRYSKFTRSMQAAKIILRQIAHFSFPDFVMSYGTSEVILSDSSRQFVNKLFPSL